MLEEDNRLEDGSQRFKESRTPSSSSTLQRRYEAMKVNSIEIEIIYVSQHPVYLSVRNDVLLTTRPRRSSFRLAKRTHQTFRFLWRFAISSSLATSYANFHRRLHLDLSRSAFFFSGERLFRSSLGISESSFPKTVGWLQQHVVYVDYCTHGVTLKCDSSGNAETAHLW